MRLLICSTYAHLPEIIGGLQTATDDFCAALIERGVEPVVLCGQSADGPGQVRRADDVFPYRVIRAADPVTALPLVAAGMQPDAIIVQTGTTLVPMMQAALASGFPTAVYLHNLELAQYGGMLVDHPALLYIANSAFTAARLRALYGIEAVILPPVIQPHRYIAPATGERVLFVNPTQIKGCEIVFRLIEAHPDIPFTIQESWALNPVWRSVQLDRLRGLHNVEWLEATQDMRSVFARSALLLMPSLWEEAFGRTVIEAQLNGLPVIASNRGALPDTVGDGGVLLDAHAPIEDWSHVLSMVYWDEGVRAHLSDRARLNARQTILGTHLAINEVLTRLALHPAPGDCLTRPLPV